MRAPESFWIQNLDATPANILIKGGVYVLDAVATWGGGSLTLTRRGPNGSTYLTAATALTADGTSGAITLPPGEYRFTIATATAVYASLVRVPGE
jgi:hypothetical protein